MNKKKKRILHKFITLLVIIAFVFSTTSIPTLIVQAKDIITEQVAYNKILKNNSQLVLQESTATESPDVSNNIIPANPKDKQDKPNQQKIDEYKSKLKSEEDSSIHSRYIVKYSNNADYDKFIKKLDKSLKKQQKLNNNKFGNFAVLEASKSIDQIGFNELIDRGLKDGTILSVQPDYAMTASADLSGDLSADFIGDSDEASAEPADATLSPFPTGDSDEASAEPADATLSPFPTGDSGEASAEPADATPSPFPTASPEGNTQNNIVVALIDSGIDMSHPDLKDAFYSNPNEIADNGLDDDNDGYIDDICGWDFF